MAKRRLDQELVARQLVASRSQAESYIKLGQVKVNDEVVRKPHQQVDESDKIFVVAEAQYVSRAALKLASVAELFQLNFTDKTVLDIGSSTGGFTEFALARGAQKVIAVEVGTNQLHPRLRGSPRIELHEQTNILDVRPWTLDDRGKSSSIYNLSSIPDLVLLDLSFVSLRGILPHVSTLCGKDTQVIAMLKPQFEVGAQAKHKGIIKNDTLRRQILKDFEEWTKKYFVILNKADSKVAGSKGNVERFYLLKKV